MQGAEFDEGGAHGALARLEREAADAVIGEGGAIAEAGGADGLFLAGVERFLGISLGFSIRRRMPSPSWALNSAARGWLRTMSRSPVSGLGSLCRFQKRSSTP